MKAMILSAGLGTRLGDLTQETPKGMLPIDGYPILAWIVANLRRQGVTELVMNLHFFPESITEYFGAEIAYSREAELQGTAGGVRDAKALLAGEDEILVHYGDIVTDQNVQEMLVQHRETNALVTLLLHERNKSNSVVAMDESRQITEFLERPSEVERKQLSSSWVNSGICICSPEIFDHIPPAGLVDLPRDVFVKLVDTGRLFGFPLTGFRCAIDSPERLESTRRAVDEGKICFHPATFDCEIDGTSVNDS
ncbi:MAG: nucleotidyltransferase family protein [Limisphaerales bacterium]